MGTGNPAQVQNLEEHSGSLRQFIRRLRQKRDLSQHQVSLEGGLSKEAVGRIERGETDPTFRTLLGVAQGLKLTPERFFRLFGRFLAGKKLDTWSLEGRYRSEDGTEQMELWTREVNPHE